MKIHQMEEEYIISEIQVTNCKTLYNLFWGEGEDESFSILCNASEEDFQKEVAYFKKFRENDDVWIGLEGFLIDRGYDAERYCEEEPTYINFNNCNL